MGRTHTIKTHPQRARIESMLADGVPQAVVAREMSLAESTLSRFVNSTKSELAKIALDEPGVTEVLSRLIAVADHAQELRKRSKLTGTPIAQTRAVKAEADILAKLLSELGLLDTSVIETLEESRALIDGFKVFLRTFPESAQDLLNVFADIPELAELAEALRARLGTRK